MHKFSQINCIMETNTLGSKDILHNAFLLLNKMKTPNETANYILTTGC